MMNENSITPERLQQQIEESIRGLGILDVTVDYARTEHTHRKVIRTHRRDASGAIEMVMFSDWDELKPMQFPPELHEIHSEQMFMDQGVRRRTVTDVSVPEKNERFK